MSGPNILILMVDQLNGTLFPDGPVPWLHAPNLRKLADRSVRFANSYTGSPLCAPGRASFMSGQLPSRTGVYDNAAEFRSDLPPLPAGEYTVSAVLEVDLGDGAGPILVTGPSAPIRVG